MRIEPHRRHEEATPLDLPCVPATSARLVARAELVTPRETPDRHAFFAGLRGSPIDAPSIRPPRDALVGGRLDAIRDAFSGPYTAEGTVVAAPPMFRMNGGANEASAQRHRRQLSQHAAQVGVSSPLVALGQGTPRDLVRVTQALIDAGHLPPPPGDLAARIRRMQWEWGIGIDCAGYTYQAAVASSGVSSSALGLSPLGMENFRGLDANRFFTKIDPTTARPGDVMTLDPLPPETVGHNVIVRAHTTTGERHVIEVDSSWGAGPGGADYGGFRRDTWTFDAEAKLWTSFDPHVSPPVVRVSSAGPAGERFHGCYRPKVGT